ncbi:DUF262 domain-containing protein [Undibacterium sp. CY21W]|uniref:DUF262 domain-containing protein n=1 Tax=Undibacterium sp. CY21W TaxID=2762293 RepID=UPI00164C62C8|nr:DUF262 domain-containing protein [Undibacterium sp. CY21W]MBC3928598.1 DUF262 domain-containing protein [Undibacterium sp. CY21W]
MMLHDEKIAKLFSGNKTVDALRIDEYLHWAANLQSYACVLAMPPIQRGFVWKAKQIQDLWDSILRGMPIGSILLKAEKANKPASGIDPSKRKIEINIKPSFHLMDGQQRTLAMLLGFPGTEGAEHKLWVDFSEAGKNGSLFQLRVTTAAQPFGFNPDGSRFSAEERRKARDKWNCGEESNEKKSNSEIFKDEKTRPWKTNGKKQEFIFEIKSLWQEIEANGQPIENMKAIQECQNYEKESNEEIYVRVKKFRSALIKLKSQWLAFIKIPDIDVQENIEDPSHDYLTMLFDRISSGGTRLSPDDLLFSMIKQSWPEAHNVVYALQQKVGALMKPTDFVMTAFRLAALQVGSPGSNDPELNAKTFHKQLGGLLEDGYGKLAEMLGEKGDLVWAFEQLIDLIKYSDNNQYGIPVAMFPYLDNSTLQVVLYWIIINKEKNFRLDESRNEILRFILFSFVCHQGAESLKKASRLAIAKIAEIVNIEKLFPGKVLYKELTERCESRDLPIFYPLINPVEKELNINQFQSKLEREKYYFGDRGASLYANFTTRKGLLLWFQRHFINAEFANDFQPTAGQDDDNVPYDFDHLVPQSNWSSLAGLNREEIKDKGNKAIFENLWHRRALGNSIGNYRITSSSKNRSRGDKPLEAEFCDEKVNWIDYALNLENELEFINWILASPANCEQNPGNQQWEWNDQRLLAFQYAVESRVLYLYEYYFNKLGFEDWVISETTTI